MAHWLNREGADAYLSTVQIGKAFLGLYLAPRTMRMSVYADDDAMFRMTSKYFIRDYIGTIEPEDYPDSIEVKGYKQRHCS